MFHLVALELRSLIARLIVWRLFEAYLPGVSKKKSKNRKLKKPFSHRGDVFYVFEDVNCLLISMSVFSPVSLRWQLLELRRLLDDLSK